MGGIASVRHRQRKEVVRRRPLLSALEISTSSPDAASTMLTLSFGAACALTLAPATPVSLPSVSARSSQPVLVVRRDACGLGAAAALWAGIGAPSSTAAAAPPLTGSQLLTAGEYLNDLRAARGALTKEITPLLELKEDRGYEATRVTIRKPPINGIRKAASKVVKLLEDNGNAELAKEKNKVYDAIKVSLGAIDDGCRPDLAKRPDLLGLLGKLVADLESFEKGLGIEAASAAPEPVP